MFIVYYSFHCSSLNELSIPCSSAFLLPIYQLFHRFQGTVIIIANHGERIDIPAGAVLENKIVSGNLRILDHWSDILITRLKIVVVSCGYIVVIVMRQHSITELEIEVSSF